MLIFPNMKIGIWQRQFKHTSVTVYTENILKFLEQENIAFYFLSVDRLVLEKGTTLLWDPSCVGGMYPHTFLCKQSIPLIVTVHGVSNMVLPLNESFSTLKEKIIGIKENTKRKIWWTIYQKKINHIITVSEFSKNEIHKKLSIPNEKITAIHHGFDSAIFYAEEKPVSDFFFHISSFSPRKNIQRIIDSYELITDVKKPALLIVSKGCTIKTENKKIEILHQGITLEQLGIFMRNCCAFVFPSIYEGFGMPLAEAMACGAPVITSNSTACKEVVDEAGIKVNPFSTDEIKIALEAVYTSVALQNELRKKSIKRAKHFSWEKCANNHIQIFKNSRN